MVEGSIMAYYTERHGLRKAIAKTYDISVDKYALLLQCCEKYYNNIAWKYPEECPDGLGCCGINLLQFNLDLKYEIPSLYRDYTERIAPPPSRHNAFVWQEESDNYDQYALLDLIEFFAKNIRDVVIAEYHSYFSHNHLRFKTSRDVFLRFKAEINGIFDKTGLLYYLHDNCQIDRIIVNSPLTKEIESAIEAITEVGTRDLLKEAISLHRSPYPADIRNATEKIWDAFERLKTYYTEMNKRDSANRIICNMAEGREAYKRIFNNEFQELTTIGNSFRIRHHETDKVEIMDARYYDYFFNRCLSLIALAIQYL